MGQEESSSLWLIARSNAQLVQAQQVKVTRTQAAATPTATPTASTGGSLHSHWIILGWKEKEKEKAQVWYGFPNQDSKIFALIFQPHHHLVSS